MQPPFNSFPHQAQSNSSISTQQVFPPNMMQSSMELHPQMGLINPQMPFPINNHNMQTMAIPNMPLPNFMNASNPFLFSQNNHLGTPQFLPMSRPINLSNPTMFPLTGQLCNLSQNASQGQLLTPNMSNLPQQLNQNLNLPNLQNPMQNVNQYMAMQMSNHLSLLGNQPRFGAVNFNGVSQDVKRNQQNLVQPVVTQQMDGNLSSPLKSGSNQQLQQNNKFQPSGFTRSQGNSTKHAPANVSHTNWKNAAGKNLSGNAKRGPAQRFQKSQFNHMDNGRRKFGFNNAHKVKGHNNEGMSKFHQTNCISQPKEKKRSLALTYTEQEIQQWREERRKNFPSKTNLEKRSTEKLSNSEVVDTEAKKRREQLKEVLVKQAELGVEVAEIPSHYLLDSEKQVCGNNDNRKPMNKRGRFQNKHDKRGRFSRKGRSSKKQKLANNDLLNASSSLEKRSPTLLEKLLSADVRKDKTRLLQVFRFMVMNSFFKDGPDKPLQFPLIKVKESRCDDEKTLHSDKVGENAKLSVQNVQNEDDDDNDDEEEEEVHDSKEKGDDNVVKERDVVYNVEGKGHDTVNERLRSEEEEGEIID